MHITWQTKYFSLAVSYLLDALLDASSGLSAKPSHKFVLTNLETGRQFNKTITCDELSALHPILFDCDVFNDIYEPEYAVPKILEMANVATIELSFTLNHRQIPITITLDKTSAEVDIGAVTEKIAVLEHIVKTQKSQIAELKKELEVDREVFFSTAWHLKNTNERVLYLESEAFYISIETPSKFANEISTYIYKNPKFKQIVDTYILKQEQPLPIMENYYTKTMCKDDHNEFSSQDRSSLFSKIPGSGVESSDFIPVDNKGYYGTADILIYMTYISHMTGGLIYSGSPTHKLFKMIPYGHRKFSHYMALNEDDVKFPKKFTGHMIQNSNIMAVFE